MKIIDLRSDTVTKPSSLMLSEMIKAEVGDDVYGEDPTVNILELTAAEIFGTEDALFSSSGTQSNLLALLSHCQRGDEYIAGQKAHCYCFEGGGAAVLGGIQPQPIQMEDDGTLDFTLIEQMIKPDNFHFARTKLICLENTHSGKVLPMDYIEQAVKFVRDTALKLHCDGARIFNAAVKLNIPVSDISENFDSVTCCLSKGLGAPVGSMLCGSQKFIRDARRWRKMLGGGMRQAGILAAAGIFALNHNIKRLEEDHNNALTLAEGLSNIDEISFDIESVQTNMVFVPLEKMTSIRLQKFLQGYGIIINKIGSDGTARLVTHLDITEKDISLIIKRVKQFFYNNSK